MAQQDISKAEASEKKPKSALVENVSIIIQAVLLALIIRTFIVQPFSIPSQSMEPNLLIGDYLITNKFAYGYSRHSFPMSIAPFEGRVLSSVPERGDIAVFKAAHDHYKDYIKRVVGLPGDTIQMIDGVLYINDEAVDRILVTDQEPASRGAKLYRETMPNGVSYLVQDSGISSGDNTRRFVVPEGHVFMMGDNRDNSSDSRFGLGAVPLEHLVGRAEFLFFSIERGGAWQVWRWFDEARFSRIFNKL